MNIPTVSESETDSDMEWESRFVRPGNRGRDDDGAPRSKSTWIAYAVDIPEETTEVMKLCCAGAIGLWLIAL